MSDRISFIPRCAYGSIWDGVGSCKFLYFMFSTLRCVVNASSCSLDLFGQHVTAHLDMPRFMCVHFES